MTAHDLPAPPPGLSPDAEALWAGFHDELADNETEPDARELAVLTEACHHLTLAARLAERLAELPDVVVPGSTGQDRVHPLVSELDKTRRTVATMLRSIKQTSASLTNSAAAASRWGRR